MICVKLFGGLGNQMFQYACGKSLAIKKNTTLVFDISSLEINSKGVTKRNLELEHLGIHVEEVTKRDLKKIKPLFKRIQNYFSIKLFNIGIQNENYFIENNFIYNKKIENISENCFLSGYWQSELYFVSIEKMIRDEFKFKNIKSEVNSKWEALIKSTNSVSIHIRRKDFISSNNKNIHGACSIEYYKKAIEYIIEVNEKSYFFIFSDDTEWTEYNFHLSSIQSFFITGNTGSNSYIDMHLMSLCKHNIIANSSFSWWAAWINSNPNKIVVAPNNWFTDTGMNSQTHDLIPNNWKSF